MRALLCHCRTHLEAKDDPALAEELRGIWRVIIPTLGPPTSRSGRSSRLAPTTSKLRPRVR